MPQDITSLIKLKPTEPSKKVINVHIPVVVSSSIVSNGLTPYVDYYVEQLYIAYNLSSFTRLSRFLLTGSLRNALSILGAIAVTYYAKDFFKKIIKDLLGNTESKKNVKLTEDSAFLWDKPREVVIDNITYSFRAVNVKNENDAKQLLRQSSSIINIFTRALKALLKSGYSILAKRYFVVKLMSELESDFDNIPVTNESVLIVVDTVNDVVLAKLKYNGQTIVNSIKLSDLMRERKNTPSNVTIDKLIRQLKDIKVTRE